MRRGTYFEAKNDSAHWVREYGHRQTYLPAARRVNDTHIGARLQTSSRPVGVAMNVPALQQFTPKINTPNVVASNRSAYVNSKGRTKIWT